MRSSGEEWEAVGGGQWGIREPQKRGEKNIIRSAILTEKKRRSEEPTKIGRRGN